jgi:hypothetical protein
MPDAPPVPFSLTPEAFISRWGKAQAAERSNYQMFLSELCDLIGVPRPDPATKDDTFDRYVFDRAIPHLKPDGTRTTVYADLYKRGCFMLETKQGTFRKEHPTEQLGLLPEEEGTSYKAGHGVRGSRQWDLALERAYTQARNYIRYLPSAEGRPPFLLVVDVGYVLELYSEFTCTGGTYVRFPDPQSHRIYLEDLRIPEVRERLRRVWTEPLTLDPSKYAARVTREVANHLSHLARSLEQDGHHPEIIATFLQRCLFTMFAEDIGLLPENAFTQKLEQLKAHPEGFPITVTNLWREMASADGWSTVLMQKIAWFNGGLFENATALPLSPTQIALLIGSAKPDWSEVEPAIFGTLLERALSPQDRHKLGAHYTPRSYVDRLVKPTIIDPLRERWENVKKAAALLRNADDLPKARAEVRNFHRYLCQIRVLDPACGSGNFLYVTLEHMKRLEGEVLELLGDLDDRELTFEMQEFKVRPQQFWGLEINERAVAIAQLVLWIGYFQWHKKTTGKADTQDRPLLPKQQTILHQDAVLAYDRKEFRLDETGRPVTIWDGRTTKPHPVTQKEVPDDTARIPVYNYVNPRRPEWPEADFIVGNPPFIGKLKLYELLGDGYIEALRRAWKGEVPDSADFVMYWWDQAAQLLRRGEIQRFGFITTNSIHQTFNRRVLEKHMNTDKNPLHIAFAIPDHPWVDSVDGAAVRIAMTVGDVSASQGLISLVLSEQDSIQGEFSVNLDSKYGTIASNLTVGIDVASASPLVANLGICGTGLILGGRGFVINKFEKQRLVEQNPGSSSLIGERWGGKDIAEYWCGLYAIDTDHLAEAELILEHPLIFQHLKNSVFPERQTNRDMKLRRFWWRYRRANTVVREASKGLDRFLVTPETSKFRIFAFLKTNTKPEHGLVVCSTNESYMCGVLSSIIHVSWALAQGGVLGPTPRYNKTRCFETFPFPDLINQPDLRSRLDELGEQLDAHRKRQQAAHPELTMTGMYNVLEKLRKEEALTDKERGIHEQGLVSVLKELHDRIDLAVLEAYGWLDLLAGSSKPIADRMAQGDEDLEQAILGRLVALNHERAEEEKRGLIRWLRPEYQNPEGKTTVVTAEQEELEVESEAPTATGSLRMSSPTQWPESLPDRIAAIKLLLPEIGPDPEALSAHFGRRAPKRITEIREILDTLRLFGHLQG